MFNYYVILYLPYLFFKFIFDDCLKCGQRSTARNLFIMTVETSNRFQYIVYRKWRIFAFGHIGQFQFLMSDVSTEAHLLNRQHYFIVIYILLYYLHMIILLYIFFFYLYIIIIYFLLLFIYFFNYIYMYILLLYISVPDNE